MSDHKPHYDHISQVYSASRQKHVANRRFMSFQHQAMLDVIQGDMRNMCVLDCMSGSCEFAYVAKDRVHKLHSTDVSQGILSHANLPLPDSRTCADANHLPFRDNSFDAVFISGGLHHVRENYKHVLGELHRIIKADGWLVIVEPADDNPVIYLMRSILHIISPLYEEGEQGFRRAELFDACENAGYVDVQIRQHGYLAYALIGNTDVFPLFSGLRSNRVIRWLLAVDRRSPYIPLWRSLALAHLVSGRIQK